MKYILKSLTLFLLPLCLSTGIICSVGTMTGNISDNVLRLHVVANSDTSYDQALKLKVRDRIIRDFSPIFSTSDNAKSSASLAYDHSYLMVKSAVDELRKNGCLYPVSIKIGQQKFPTKSYGNVRLPAGEYNAITLKIGGASGQNWWCVMYPPLCLTNGIVEADQQTIDKLRKELTSEEFDLITKTQKPNVKFKFKIAEILGKYF